jgi:hypothetical protein
MRDATCRIWGGNRFETPKMRGRTVAGSKGTGVGRRTVEFSEFFREAWRKECAQRANTDQEVQKHPPPRILAPIAFAPLTSMLKTTLAVALAGTAAAAATPAQPMRLRGGAATFSKLTEAPGAPCSASVRNMGASRPPLPNLRWPPWASALLLRVIIEPTC